MVKEGAVARADSDTGLWNTLCLSSWIVGFSLLTMAFRAFTLGSYPLSDNTEARYAEIARRMAETGDWVTLRLPGDVVFWGKPPLSSWLSAAGLQFLGVGEWGARLPVLVVALVTTALIWLWARTVSARAGALAVALLWGSAVFFASAGAVMTDMALTLSIVMSLSGFWWAVAIPGSRNQSAEAALFVGLALGVLAKGPVALVLALGPILAYALSGRDARHATLALPWVKGAALTLAISAPWYVMAELRTPGFMEYFFVGEHWKRFTQPGWTGDLYGTAHQQPKGLIWPLMALAMMPWTLLVPMLALGRRRSSLESPPQTRSLRSDHVLLVAWAMMPAVLFTVASNILWTYVLPAAPAVAILMARWLERDARHRLVNTVVCSGLALLLAGSSLLLLWQSERGGLRSAVGVLNALTAAGHELSEVTVMGSLPLSASFYSHGQMTTVIGESQLEEWVRSPVASVHGHGFLVVTTKAWERVPGHTRQRLAVVLSSGGYVLLERAFP